MGSIVYHSDIYVKLRESQVGEGIGVNLLKDRALLGRTGSEAKDWSQPDP
jgi:hypothetical protein